MLHTTYEEYITMPRSISLEKMQKLHSQMLDLIKEDEDAEELYQELIEYATRYAFFRENWLLWDRATKAERDSSRSSCHNSLSVKFNMLA